MDRNVYGGALYARALTLNHKFGKDGLHQILSEMRKTGYAGPIEIAEIKPKQRYPVEYLQQMNLAILNEYGEEKFQQIARDAAKRRGIVGVFVKWATSLEMIMKRAPEYWSEFYDFGTMKTEHTDEGYKLILHDAYVDPLFCKYLTNYYWGILVSAKIKGEIVHNKCQGRGDGHCEWQIITGEQKAAQTEEISIEKSTRMQEAKQNTQESEPAPKKPAPDSECPHLAQCYIFIHGVKDSEDKVYAKIWCTTKDMYPNCMRKQLKEAGREVPKNLLPNGKYR